jgi:hypothetical protein
MTIFYYVYNSNLYYSTDLNALTDYSAANNQNNVVIQQMNIVANEGQAVDNLANQLGCTTIHMIP